jgi:hypothetical protein
MLKVSTVTAALAATFGNLEIPPGKPLGHKATVRPIQWQFQTRPTGATGNVNAWETKTPHPLITGLGYGKNF